MIEGSAPAISQWLVTAAKRTSVVRFDFAFRQASRRRMPSYVIGLFMHEMNPSG